MSLYANINSLCIKNISDRLAQLIFWRGAAQRMPRRHALCTGNSWQLLLYGNNYDWLAKTKQEIYNMFSDSEGGGG